MAKQKITQREQPGVQAVVSLADLGLSQVAERRELSPVGFATVVRSLLQNWRQGTVACKGRSDVSYSNKKPWKQKGTGRARAGSARSPIWRGGGVTFGPQARTRTLKVPRELTKNVLNNIFFDFIDNKRIISLEWTMPDLPNTSAAFAALKSAQLIDKKVNLFLLTSDTLSHASFVNIPHVQVLYFDQANAFDLVNNGYWVFLKKDADAFREMVSQWI